VERRCFLREILDGLGAVWVSVLNLGQFHVQLARVKFAQLLGTISRLVYVRHVSHRLRVEVFVLTRIGSLRRAKPFIVP